MSDDLTWHDFPAVIAEGRRYADRGEHASASPYRIGTVKHYAWMRGWVEQGRALSTRKPR